MSELALLRTVACGAAVLMLSAGIGVPLAFDATGDLQPVVLSVDQLLALL